MKMQYIQLYHFFIYLFEKCIAFNAFLNVYGEPIFKILVCRIIKFKYVRISITTLVT